MNCGHFFMSLFAVAAICGCTTQQTNSPFQALSEVTADPSHMEAVIQAKTAVSGKETVPEITISFDESERTETQSVINQESAEAVQNAGTGAQAMNVPTEVSPFSSEAVIVDTNQLGFPTEESFSILADPTEIVSMESQPNAQPIQQSAYTYQLHPGETPICIARRYNLDSEVLLAANNITNNDSVQAGTVLSLPVNTEWNIRYGSRITKRHPALHIVEAGDTVYGIACQYGDVTPENIAAANGISVETVLTAGQQLQIP